MSSKKKSMTVTEIMEDPSIPLVVEETPKPQEVETMPTIKETAQVPAVPVPVKPSGRFTLPAKLPMSPIIAVCTFAAIAGIGRYIFKKYYAKS